MFLLTCVILTDRMRTPPLFLLIIIITLFRRKVPFTFQINRFGYALVNNYSLYGNSEDGVLVLLSFGFFLTYIMIRYIIGTAEQTKNPIHTRNLIVLCRI